MTSDNGLSGSSQTVRRPFRQSSITRTRCLEAFNLFSSTPGQRSSKGNLYESEYTRKTIQRVWAVLILRKRSSDIVALKAFQQEAPRSLRIARLTVELTVGIEYRDEEMEIRYCCLPDFDAGYRHP